MVRVFRLLGMCCLLSVPTVMNGQQKPLLTIDEAVALALRNNRPVKSAVIDIATGSPRGSELQGYSMVWSSPTWRIFGCSIQ